MRAEGGIALAAGENTSNPIDFKHMFDAGAVTYAQPSVTKIGGISALREVARWPDAAGVTLVPHSPHFGPGLPGHAAIPGRPAARATGGAGSTATSSPISLAAPPPRREGKLAVRQGPASAWTPIPR